MNNCRKLEIGSKHSCYTGKVAERFCLRNEIGKVLSKGLMQRQSLNVR